jgi:hypothetical protein
MFSQKPSAYRHFLKQALKQAALRHQSGMSHSRSPSATIGVPRLPPTKASHARMFYPLKVKFAPVTS